VIPYISDEQADAATKNPELKLMFRLLNFSILDEGERNLGRMPGLNLIRLLRC
jgi:replication fork protection complex subunit Tof1/Swi1